MICSKCGKEITGDYDFCMNCGDRIEKVSNIAEESISIKNKFRNRRIPIIIGTISAVIVCIVALLIFLNSPIFKYKNANKLISDGKYDEAISVYQELGDYKESKEKIIECNRRKLYDYIDKNGKIFISSLGRGFAIEVADESLKFSHCSTDTLRSTTSNVEFDFLMDMTSDSGEFYVGFVYSSIFRTEETTGGGTLRFSKLSSNGNSLVLDEYSGSLGKNELLSMANLWSQMLCGNINDMLKESGLNLTAKDLGLIRIKN